MLVEDPVEGKASARPDLPNPPAALQVEGSQPAAAIVAWQTFKEDAAPQTGQPAAPPRNGLHAALTMLLLMAVSVLAMAASLPVLIWAASEWFQPCDGSTTWTRFLQDTVVTQFIWASCGVTFFVLFGAAFVRASKLSLILFCALNLVSFIGNTATGCSINIWGDARLAAGLLTLLGISWSCSALLVPSDPGSAAGRPHCWEALLLAACYLSFPLIVLVSVIVFPLYSAATDNTTVQSLVTVLSPVLTVGFNVLERLVLYGVLRRWPPSQAEKSGRLWLFGFSLQLTAGTLSRIMITGLPTPEARAAVAFLSGGVELLSKSTMFWRDQAGRALAGACCRQHQHQQQQQQQPQQQTPVAMSSLPARAQAELTLTNTSVSRLRSDYAVASTLAEYISVMLAGSLFALGRLFAAGRDESAGGVVLETAALVATQLGIALLFDLLYVLVELRLLRVSTLDVVGSLPRWRTAAFLVPAVAVTCGNSLLVLYAAFDFIWTTLPPMP